MDKIINEIDINKFKYEFQIKNIIRINNFLKDDFVEVLFKDIVYEKNWTLATGIDQMKYEKSNDKKLENINKLQIKNVNNAFGNDRFTYIFYRSMNGIKMSYFEFTLRNILNSKSFIDLLNEITGLELTTLTTLFLSKYSSGNFLSPHSDKGNGSLAFVINLTKYWKPQYGGILHFMDEFRKEIINSYVPTFNTFLIFYIPKDNGIPHFISHVSPNVKVSRYAITGWFN
jgi:Rps23 Pro-64 3,4-dihydroxylase Tpa1-like proline 4-hydroxylase